MFIYKSVPLNLYRISLFSESKIITVVIWFYHLFKNDKQHLVNDHVCLYLILLKNLAKIEIKGEEKI